jgi:tRNA pseudouridine55 synthase
MATGGGPSGILLVDKPAGWTSHDVVAKARRLLGQRRIGHTGTLDPAATGLLVLCAGTATRLVEYMTRHDKTYSGVVMLGVTTDTDDAEGAVVSERPVPLLGEADAARVVSAFTGDIQQRPPAYSAISVGGERAYAAARAGREVALVPRTVVIHRLAITVVDETHLAIEVECGPGTYIRSLARDIGEFLGCGGHLASLRRTRVGGFTVSMAWLLTELLPLDARAAAERLLCSDDGVTEMPAAVLRPETADMLVQGRAAAVAGQAETQTVRLYDAGGGFRGIGTVEGALLRPAKIIEAAG